MGCYIWYSEERPEWAAARPSPLIAVPNVTEHILLYYYNYYYYYYYYYKQPSHLVQR